MMKSMTVTTIKLESDVRDRLKAQAAAAHRTLGEHLGHLADDADRASRFATLRESIAATSAAGTAGWHEETELWEDVELGSSADR